MKNGTYKLRRATIWALALCAPCVLTHGDEARPDSLAAEIDRRIAERWTAEGQSPAPAADDAEFLRRVTLDVVGRIPTHDEIQEFLADSSSEKRAALVDRLVASREFAVHFANQWNAHFLGRTAYPAPGPWMAWWREAMHKGESWREICRAMLDAQPEGVPAAEHGPSEFLVRRLSTSQPLDEVTRDVTRLMFGVDMQCARCHVHPEVSEWETSSYWGMAAFFNRSYVVEIDGRKFAAERARGEASYTDVETKESQTAIPRFMTGLGPPPEPTPPTEDAEKLAARKTSFPDAKEDSPLLDNPDDYVVPPAEKPQSPSRPKYSRRAALVELALNADNPYFTRAVVNRVWAWMFGQGLIEPLDQLHSANPATHPELLDALCADFVAHNYNLQRLVSEIAKSRVYQLSSVRLSSSVSPNTPQYVQARLKPLTARQWACATLCSLGYVDAIADGREEFEAYYDQRLAELTRRFDPGSDEFQPGAPLALYLANNAEFAKLVAESPLVCELSALADDEARIRRAFEAALSRPPDADELSVMRAYLAARNERPNRASEQMIWSLLISSEFRFNH